MSQPPTTAPSSTTATHSVTAKEKGSRGDQSTKSRVIKKGLFSKELPSMMYGFGDSPQPAFDTVNLMEELLVEHITEVCLAAQRIATNRSRIKLEDVKFALRHDAKKLARIDELLFMKEDIDRARGRKGGLEEFADEEEMMMLEEGGGKKKKKSKVK